MSDAMTEMRNNKFLRNRIEVLERQLSASNELFKALNAMLTEMGMDENEWNRPTFEQARAAIAKATGEQE
jgi:hypothetical protein